MYELFWIVIRSPNFMTHNYTQGQAEVHKMFCAKKFGGNA